MIKKVAVLTSGGDAPGMNAAIRAVTRSGLKMGLEVFGVYDGYRGLCEGKFEKLNRRSVSETIAKGGTILGTTRLPEFEQYETRLLAIEQLENYGIDALVAIGGDGTYRGALALSKMGVKVVTIPASIDNDVGGTDYAIGFETALNTIIEAVDKLRDTSSSHRRCSIIEVMGRNCGELAITSGLAVGAEVVICKELGFNLEDVLENINQASKVKRHAIVIVTEKMVDINELAKAITENTPFESRATILGHVQRGGKPTPHDRVIASLMGAKAVEALLEGQNGVCVCMVDNKIIVRPIEEALQDNRNTVLEKYNKFKMLW